MRIYAARCSVCLRVIDVSAASASFKNMMRNQSLLNKRWRVICGLFFLKKKIQQNWAVRRFVFVLMASTHRLSVVSADGHATMAEKRRSMFRHQEAHGFHTGQVISVHWIEVWAKSPWSSFRDRPQTESATWSWAGCNRIILFPSFSVGRRQDRKRGVFEHRLASRWPLRPISIMCLASFRRPASSISLLACPRLTLESLDEACDNIYKLYKFTWRQHKQTQLLKLLLGL